jgi:LPXTG-motif cell wall-anchored protein
MNAKQRLKLGAGAGLVTMLLGALMVLAPTAGAVVWDGSEGQPDLDEGGNLNCTSLDPAFTEEAKNDLGQTVGNIAGDGWNVDFELLASGSVEITVLPGSRPVHAVIIKTGNASVPQSNGHLSYEVFEPPVVGAEPDGTVHLIAYTGSAISNIKVCGEEREEPMLTVTKVVNSNDQAALAATFPIAVEQDEAVVQSGSLGHNGSLPVIDPASGEYEISEDLPEDGWETPTIDCVGADATGGAGGPWTVEVDDVDVVCTITNTPEADEPEEPTLTVTKVIDSEDQQALAATFPIAVEQDEAVVESDSLGHDESLPVIDSASGEYEISEDLPEDGWETPTIDCVGATATGGEGGPWTVEVDDVDVVCTITNTPESDTPLTPPTPSFTYGLDVDKVNDADDDGEFSDRETADEEGAAVEFQITIRNTGSGPLNLVSIKDRIFGVTTIDLLEEGVLDCGDVELEVGSSLAAGAVITCTFELDDYAPAPGTSQTNTVDVVTDRAEDEDTSVVDVDPIEVLPAPPVTPPGPPAVTPPVVTPPQAQPAVQPAQVLGAQTVRTLPRTGDETRGLAGAGAFMVALGAALVLSTRRQYADR